MNNHKFKVGDKVKMLGTCGDFHKGKIYTVATEDSCGNKLWQLVKPETPKKEIAISSPLLKVGDKFIYTKEMNASVMSLKSIHD